jgi:cystathionine beta-lyase/cystathionine gamma-synthase
VAGLEEAEAAEAFSSGMAAISSVFLALCRSGDRIMATRQLYGNTYSLLAGRLRDLGLVSEFYDADDLAGIESHLDGAAMLYTETIGNPRLQISDLEALGRLARAAGVPLVVDNTFASPILCRPLEHGATISLHSATKFIGGHHDLMGGVVCTDERTLAPIRELARDLGPTLSPFNSFLALRGLQTIHLRVPRSCATALTVARGLREHPAIAAVFYPGLEDDPYNALARRLLGGFGGGVVGFDVAGGRDRARRFQEALQLVLPAASLGGTHSLIVHAASVTHTQLNDRELEEAGISAGYCRLSIGLEDADDVVEDLTQALDSV